MSPHAKKKESRPQRPTSLSDYWQHAGGPQHQLSPYIIPLCRHTTRTAASNDCTHPPKLHVTGLRDTRVGISTRQAILLLPPPPHVNTNINTKRQVNPGLYLVGKKHDKKPFHPLCACRFDRLRTKCTAVHYTVWSKTQFVFLLQKQELWTACCITLQSHAHVDTINNTCSPASRELNGQEHPRQKTGKRALIWWQAHTEGIQQRQKKRRFECLLEQSSMHCRAHHSHPCRKLLNVTQ